MKQKHIDNINEFIDNQVVQYLKIRAVNLGNCGAIDTEEYDDNDFTIVKILVTAALKDLANNIMPLSNKARKEVKNLSHF